MTFNSKQFKSWEEAVKACAQKSFRNQFISMRDGIRLDTNIYLPITETDQVP